ncbi:MAG: hypothetical protein OK457_03370 [Thaumarchaeota archaeon]|nr:hypothetical protein [Nitrososphaerota archaeon]
MSFSGGSGRSFSGKKGFSSAQKKDRKKKQEFHTRRLKYTPEEHLDFSQLKNRVSIALDRLGNQVFSLEPGAYDFGHWVSSFNLLLDDFEEKAVVENLPQEYFDSRQKLTAELSSPLDTSSIDLEIQQLESDIGLLRDKISEIQRKAESERNQYRIDSTSKLEALKKERLESDLELSRARTMLEERKKVEAKQSVFGKLFSRSSPSSSRSTQSRIHALEVRKNELDESLGELAAERAKKQSIKKDQGGETIQLRIELENTQQKMGELQAQKLEMLQFAGKRREVTQAMSEIISGLQLHPEAEDDSSALPVN